jgi:dolichyl-phosphate-mannose--protein O-mannosyl transferase
MAPDSARSVTCYAGRDDNDLWIIRRAPGHDGSAGVKMGDVIVLIHKQTGYSLHSHHAPSPVTKQQGARACVGSRETGRHNRGQR